MFCSEDQEVYQLLIVNSHYIQYCCSCPLSSCAGARGCQSVFPQPFLFTLPWCSFLPLPTSAWPPSWTLESSPEVKESESHLLMWTHFMMQYLLRITCNKTCDMTSGQPVWVFQWLMLMLERAGCWCLMHNVNIGMFLLLFNFFFCMWYDNLMITEVQRG